MRLFPVPCDFGFVSGMRRKTTILAGQRSYNALMRTRFLVLLLFPFFLPAQTGSRPATAQNQPQASPQAQPNEQQETTEEMRADLQEGIKHMLVSQIDAWNHGRLEGFMQGYWHSPDLTFFSGASVTKGWEPTLLRYRERYQGEHKEMGHLEFQDLGIELLSRKAAVVTGKWQLTMSDGKQPHGLFTLIVKRMPAGWRIVHDHTSSE
jgi:beta-aspartyl-peptidase (threonine type)